MTEIPKGTTCQGSSQWRPCKYPAKHMVTPRSWHGDPIDGAATVDKPMCGVHRNENERAHERLKNRKTQLANERERQKRVSYAHNVAMMLGQAIGARYGLNVVFDVPYRGDVLHLDVAVAEKLFNKIAKDGAP